MKPKKSPSKDRKRIGKEKDLREQEITNNLGNLSSISSSKLEKKINEFITIKLEGGRTFIYISGKKFIQCIRLILNIQKEDTPLYDEIESIDEAAKVYSRHLHQNRIIGNQLIPRRINQPSEITPEQEFWGHCSNIQAWVENDYDTRILMRNISFPLLRELTKVGDPKAKRVYKEEIALRLESGYPSVVQYLLTQRYLQVFTTEEFQSILEATPIIKNLSSNHRLLFYFFTSCLRYFPNLVEDILLQLLKLPNGKEILISSLKKSETSPWRGGHLLYRKYRNLFPSILYQLRTHLEHLILRYEENLGEDIIDCIHFINESLEFQTDVSHYRTWNAKFLDQNMLDHEQLQEMMELDRLELREQLNARRLGMSLEGQARCSYCGRIIRPGQDVCDWCGHEKNEDDDGFFPYPYIFKPPDGGGGVRTLMMNLYPSKKKN